MKPDTGMSYLFALKSYYINRGPSLNSFNDLQIALIIKGGRKLFFQITKDILKKITEDKPLYIMDLNVDTAFKVTWAGFMKMGELTYTAVEAKKTTFAETNLTRSDISFAERDQYAILQFKQNKTDIEHTGMQIVLTATGERICRVVALRRLFTQDPCPPNAPLFRVQS